MQCHAMQTAGCPSFSLTRHVQQRLGRQAEHPIKLFTRQRETMQCNAMQSAGFLSFSLTRHVQQRLGRQAEHGLAVQLLVLGVARHQATQHMHQRQRAVLPAAAAAAAAAADSMSAAV